MQLLFRGKTLCCPKANNNNNNCPGLPGGANTRKVKRIWILLKQETVSGSGISWAICKSAPRSRQITMPAPHHSVFFRPDALPAAQPTASKHWRKLHFTRKRKKIDCDISAVDDRSSQNLEWWCRMCLCSARLLKCLFKSQVAGGKVTWQRHWACLWSYSVSSPVSTRIGDRIWVGIGLPLWYITKPFQ